MPIKGRWGMGWPKNHPGHDGYGFHDAEELNLL